MDILREVVSYAVMLIGVPLLYMSFAKVVRDVLAWWDY